MCFTAGAETDANEGVEKNSAIFLTPASDAIATLSLLLNTSGVLKCRINDIHFSYTEVLLKLSNEQREELLNHN